jgi:hypothetical protein
MRVLGRRTCLRRYSLSCVPRLAKSDTFAAGPALFDEFNAGSFKITSYRRFVGERNWNFPVNDLDSADGCDPNLGCRGQIGGDRSVGNKSRRLTFFMLPLSQPDTRSATVLIDELHAGSLQNTRDCRERRCVPCVPPSFDVGNRIAMELGRRRKVSDGPV